MATRRREQEVWQACDDLWALSADLVFLTGDAIRERLMALGKSRGSPNEIYKYRKTWVESRGVKDFNRVGHEDAPSDPISRAVRLVHENLLNESNKKVELLNEEHQQELLKKDEELKLTKEAVSNLMEEYRALCQKLEETTISLNRKSAEHLSEIEVRKALERELSLIKLLSDQQMRAKDELISELKNAHGLEIVACERRYNELLEERKRLGQEYSDQLTAQKISFKNQEILTKEQEKKVLDIELELKALREKNSDKDRKISWLIEENNRMADTIGQKSTELLAHKASFDLAISDRKHLSICLKRAEFEVAKLRAMAKANDKTRPLVQ